MLPVQMASTHLKAKLIAYHAHLAKSALKLVQLNVKQEHFQQMVTVNALDVQRDSNALSLISQSLSSVLQEHMPTQINLYVLSVQMEKNVDTEILLVNLMMDFSLLKEQAFSLCAQQVGCVSEAQHLK